MPGAKPSTTEQLLLMGGKPLNREIINGRLAERGIVMLSEYVHQSIPARFCCPQGHTWDGRPGNVLSGKGCPTCGRASVAEKKRLPEDTVRQRLAEKGITLVGNYVDTQTKTSFQCEEGHVWETTPNAVMSRTGCPVCAGNLPLTKEAINSRIDDRGLTLAGEYHGAHVATLFECGEGHSWLARPNNILQGRNCPHCARQFPLDKETVNERIAYRGIVMLGDYTNNFTKALFQCSEGHTWEASPQNVLAGTGCPVCAGNMPHTKETVNARIADRGIRMIDEYVNNHTRATFDCEEGHTWVTAPANVLSGTGCPTCAERYSDNDVFYIWLAGPQRHIDLHPGEYLLKFGISSERRGDLRMKEIGWAWGTTADLIAVVRTSISALLVEKRAEAIGKPLPNNLSLLDGWTEFRVVNQSQVAQFMSLADEAAEYKILWRNPVPGVQPCGFDQLTFDFYDSCAG